MNKDYFKHETAIIDDGAVIGDDTRIWHFCHVMGGAKIGKHCSLGQNVYVGNVNIGNNVKVQNNVSIYDGVEIEDDVFCGPSCVFTNVINPRSQINRQGEYLQTKIQKGVTIGANATIVCGVSLGAYSFIAAGAVITKNTKPFSLNAGIPGKIIGWISRFGATMKFDDHNEYLCPETGEKYLYCSDTDAVTLQK